MRRGAREGGAAMVLCVLLLAALAGTGMLWSLEVRAVKDMEARARVAGAVFAQWFQAAHHLAQSEEARYRSLVALHGGGPIPAAVLRSAGLAPAWMSTRTDAGQAITLGVIDDGRGVPMAYALATPARPLSALYLENFVAGAAANRVGDVAEPGREAQATRWQGAIEQVLGRRLGPGELYASADAGIAHDRRVVYRRAQPGRSGRSRMETALVFGGGAGISDVGELDTARAELAGGLTVGTLHTGGRLDAQRARVAGEVRARHLEGQGVTVRAALAGSQWRTGRVGARSLVVETELAAGGAEASGTVVAPDTLVSDRDIEATALRSSRAMSEGLEAWGAPGRLGASAGVDALYSVGERAVFRGTVTVTGECAGC